MGERHIPLKNLVAAGIIAGGLGLAADNHSVSAGGGPEGTPGWSQYVDRQNYIVAIPNPGVTKTGIEWKVYRVSSKTEDIQSQKIKKLNLSRKFPFIHSKKTLVEKTGERGLYEGIDELRQNCEMTDVWWLDNSTMDIEVKDTTCFPVFIGPRLPRS